MNHPGAGSNTNGGAFAGPKRAMPNPNGALAGAKRGRPDLYGGFADPKRVKGPQLNQPGLGGKSKPCAMFFSPSGCQYGDACQFLHYVPGGFNVFAQKPNMGNPVSTPQRIPMGPPGFSQASPAAVKTLICSKYNTAEGCKFGEKCHYAHGEREMGQPVAAPVTGPAGGKFPGQFQPPQPVTGPASSNPPKIPKGPPGFSQAPPTAVKTLIGSKYNTAEGCKFGMKCHYAHGKREIGQPVVAPVTGPAGGTFPGHFQPPQPVTGPAGRTFRGRLQPPQPVTTPAGGTFLGRFQPPLPPAAAAAAVVSYGASTKAKFSVDASLAGHIIGKNGANIKQIYHVTGAKIFIKDHESDAAQKNIELVGTFDQIENASSMVQQLIINISATMIPKKNPARPAPGGPPGNFKTKLCENFAKGECSYGDRCNFAHGESELRA